MKILGKDVTLGKRLEQNGDVTQQRKGFNILCDAALSNRIRLLALVLECPIYALAEHLMELGMNEVVMLLMDDTLKEQLKTHLLKEHVLVEGVNENNIPFSYRAMRISAALRLLDEPLMTEKKSPTPEYLNALVNRISIAMKIVQLTETKGVSREQIVKVLDDLEKQAQTNKPYNQYSSYE